MKRRCRRSLIQRDFGAPRWSRPYRTAGSAWSSDRTSWRVSTRHAALATIGDAPLRGVRIIAVEQYGAGPFGTLFLSDMGAEIIKIEDPAVGGDISRYVPPGQQGRDSLFFEAFNRGKRSLALDLKNEAAQGVLQRLVTQSHALFTNLRGDLPEELGLTYETLARFNPAIVCVSLSAYGRTGGRRTHPGYDALIQAEAGWAAMTGEPDGPPVKSGLSLVDYSAGLMAALALMAGVFDAQRTGRGRNIDTSLYDAALSLLTYPATWYLTQGVVTERLPNSAHPSIVPFQFFATADGHIAIACAKEKFFKALAAALKLPSDARFVSFEGASNQGAATDQPWWATNKFTKSQEARAVWVWTPNSTWLNE